MPLITLTTDFGSRDWFVGTMKGVILGIAPKAQIVDITHEIPPGDIRGAAFALAAAAPFFPKDAIHLAVVDPGVGSNRRAIAIQTRTAMFIGPDNGVLSLAVAHQSIRTIRRLTNPACFRTPVSRTFHGRDVFAPVAAHIGAGASVAKLGPRAADYVRLRWPPPGETGSGIQGEVIHIDRFGNAITNIVEDRSAPDLAGAGEVRIGRRVAPVNSHYGAVALGKPVAVFGSSGYLEIAINGGSAADQLKLRLGSKVLLT